MVFWFFLKATHNLSFCISNHCESKSIWNPLTKKKNKTEKEDDSHSPPRLEQSPVGLAADLSSVAGPPRHVVPWT